MDKDWDKEWNDVPWIPSKKDLAQTQEHWYEYRKEAYVPSGEVKHLQDQLEQARGTITNLQKEQIQLNKLITALRLELEEAMARPQEGWKCPECDEVKSVKDFENNDFICAECRSNR